MSDLYSPYGSSGGSSNPYTVNRIGAAAAATTPPGQTPSFGLAVDLANAQWENSEQFNSFTRDSVELSQAVELERAKQAQLKTLHDMELEKALNWQDSGLDVADDASNFSKVGNFFKQAFETPKRLFEETKADDPEDQFKAYTKSGGLLTRDEFMSMDEGTRAFLKSNAGIMRGLQEDLQKPGIKQAATALGYGYKGLTTPFIMMGDSAAQNPDGVPFHLGNVLDLKIWFNGDNWSHAWREANDQSLGQALVNTQLRPYVSEDTLDEWGKHNSLYQTTAFGAEFVAGWYADPSVIAGKALRESARIKTNKMPLKEDGATSIAMRQALHGEQISTSNPFVRKVAGFRAQRMLDSQEGVNQYLKNVSYAEAARLPMAKNATAGAPLMYALHWANNRQLSKIDNFLGSSKIDDALETLSREKGFQQDGLDLVDLTWRMGAGDPKAYAMVNKLKTLVPDDLEAIAGPGARTYIDALEAVKTKANQLELEADDLIRQGGLFPGNTFHQWEIHTELGMKQKQLTEATDALKGYEGYGTWLELMGTKAGDKALPLLNQIKAPSLSKWNGVEKRRGTGTSRFFMDNQFGKAHTVREIPRATWIQKANTASMHDLDSGVLSLRRQAEQYEHLFGYADPDALDNALNAWNTAPTNLERYKTLHEFEETHLIRAASQHFGVGEDLIRTIFNKVNDERNKMIRAVVSGKDSVYSSAPSLAARVADADDHSVSLLSHSDDGKTAQLQLMDGRDHKVTITVPDAALVERVMPVDITQTPNYYTPIDTRQFFYELKRHKDMLHELDKGWFANSEAGLMESIDTIGSTFNQLWKPLQLWRLGWPQRVLMDEGMRAMAIFGPMYWLTGPGAEAVYSAGRNIPSWAGRKVSERRNGQVSLGAGPITRHAKRESDPFARAAEVRAAVKVPEALWPKINPERHAVITDATVKWSDWKRTADKFSAMGAKGWRDANPAPRHPMLDIFDHWQSKQPEMGRTPMVYDPASRSRAQRGFIVPIKNFSTSFKGIASEVDRGNLAYWYEQNSEMLSRAGMRLMVDRRGQVTIGRWFNSKQRKQAQQFLQYVDDTHPGSKMWDLNDGRSIHVADYDRPTAADQAALREAIAEDEARRARLANADLKYRENDETLSIAEAFDLFDLDIDSSVSRVTRKLAARREFGGGTVTLRSSDGREFTVDKAYEGHNGQMFRALTSSNKTIDILSEGHGGALSLARRQAQGHKTYHPPVFSDAVLKKGTAEHKKAVLYFQRWADMVNDQIGNSPIWNKMLRGWSDAKIVAWLDETPEGASLRREMMREGQVSELWVNEHRAKLNYYLPSDKLQRLLAKNRLEPSDLRKNVHNDDLPDVFGPDLEVLDKRRGMGKFLNDAAEKIWTSLGTVPIDALSRHPFAKAMYDMKMRSLIASTDSKWLDGDTIARMQRQAHDYAMQQVKKTLWDLTDETNFTDALRFVAPFWGAQQEAITKWLRIIADRPETVARFFVGQRAVYNNFVVVDEEGNEKKTGIREGGMHELGLYHPEDRVIVNIPSFMRHGPLGKALETIGAVGIPMGSANTVLQGELPLMPGPGPMLTIPADKFFRTISDTYGTTDDENFVYRWLFPIGRPSGGTKGIMEQLSPGWGKRVMSATAGEDDVAKANLYMQTAREMYLRAQRDGKPIPTNEEIAKQARWVWGLRVAAGLTMPVQTEFRPKNQFFLDAAHRYQREYGTQWFDKFLDDFGDEMAIYATSSSNSLVGVPPTSEGMEDWSQNKRLIAKYPKWGDAIISPDAYNDDFSYDAYKAQFDITLGPGDSRHLRELTSPQERFARADERVGWRDFRKFQAAVDAELYNRGLTSIQNKGAEDLQMLKRAFLEDLTAKHPAWRESYDTTANDIYERVAELQKFAFNKEFDNRPDMQGVRQYLIIRQQVTDELDAYAAATGGSRSLQAQENGALRNWFYSQVGQLVLANPAFGEFHTRYLDSDTLEQGSGGF